MLPLAGARLATVWTRARPTHAPCTEHAMCALMVRVWHVIHVPVLGGVYMRTPSWGPKSSPKGGQCDRIASADAAAPSPKTVEFVN